MDDASFAYLHINYWELAIEKLILLLPVPNSVIVMVMSAS